MYAGVTNSEGKYRMKSASNRANAQRGVCTQEDQPIIMAFGGGTVWRDVRCDATDSKIRIGPEFVAAVKGSDDSFSTITKALGMSTSYGMPEVTKPGESRFC